MLQLLSYRHRVTDSWCASATTSYLSNPPSRLAVQHYIGYHMERLVDKGTTVHALVHALENHRGPSFYPPSNFHKALPETDLALTPTSCDGKVSELGTVQGGQSTFNPNAMAAISDVEVVPLRLVRACNRAGGAPKSTDVVTLQQGSTARCV